jgi:sulfur-oxidizing protein SoxB
VENARAAGAQLVVLSSHNGFDVDRKLASRVEGIDVILTGHTHDALPTILNVNDTLLVAAGSHGKFLARLDLDVRNGRIADYAFKLIPVFSDVVPADQEMEQLVARIRAPHESFLNEELARTDSLLYRRGNFNGTFDDLLCDAMLAERDAEIALSPGFRWGSSLLPGMSIRMEDVYNQTAITYPSCYRMEMTGETIRVVLEDVADNLFNVDPYYQQGGDMVRVGGLGYTIDITQPIGKRISEMTLLSSGKPIDPAKSYVVTGWASVNPDVEGPPIFDVVADYLRGSKVVNIPENRHIKILGA